MGIYGYFLEPCLTPIISLGSLHQDKIPVERKMFMLLRTSEAPSPVNLFCDVNIFSGGCGRLCTIPSIVKP